MDLKKYLKKGWIISIVSIIGATALTVPLTTMISNYMNRGKPEISLSNIYFSNDANHIIEIPGTLLEQESLIRTYVNLSKYMRYEEVLNEEHNIAKLISELEYSKEVISLWIQENKDMQRFDYSDLIKMPIMQFQNLQITLIEMIFLYNDSLEDVIVNVGLDEHKEMIIPCFVQGDLIGFRFKKYDQVFANLLTYNISDQENIMDLFYSIVFSNMDNLNGYHHFLEDKLDKYIYNLQKYKKELVEVLLFNTHLDLEMIVYNKGHSHTILSPYYKIDFKHEEYKDIQLYLEAIEIMDETKEILNDYANNMTTDLLAFLKSPELLSLNLKAVPDFSFPNTDSIKSENSNCKFVSLKPGESKVIKLRTTIKLEENGKKLYSNYLASLIKYQIIGKTVDGKKIESTNSIFGVQQKEDISSMFQ